MLILSRHFLLDQKVTKKSRKSDSPHKATPLAQIFWLAHRFHRFFFQREEDMEVVCWLDAGGGAQTVRGIPRLDFFCFFS